MSAPHRLDIHLRPGATPGDPIEARIGADGVWRDTGLHPRAVFNHATSETFEDLFNYFLQSPTPDAFEASLNVDAQRYIGRLLMQGLFQSPAEITRDWLHIVTEGSTDPGQQHRYEAFRDFVLRLPWSLLHEPTNISGGGFLAFRKVMPCAITLDAAFAADFQAPFPAVKLPLRPRILLVIPEAEAGDQRGDIKAKDHEKALRYSITTAHSGDPMGSEIRTARTFSELEAYLRGNDGVPFNPHVIYFYGHGTANDTNTYLEFGRSDLRDVALLAAQIQELWESTRFAPVVWINACQGAIAASSNVLRSISPYASAVITTRAVAAADDCRLLAELALPDIAIRGRAPHAAMRGAVAELIERNVDVYQSARWATTFVSVQYDLWSPLDLEDRVAFGSRDSAGDVPSRLDRAAALDVAGGAIRTAINQSAATPLPIAWFGIEDDAIEVFEQRLVDYVDETFPNWDCQSYRVDLQPEAVLKEAAEPEQLPAQFLRAMRHAFLGTPWKSADQIPDFPSLAGDFAHFRAGYPTVLVFRHGPLQSAHAEIVAAYRRFWADFASRLKLPPDRVQIVLTFRFSVDDGNNLVPDAAAVMHLGPVPRAELEKHLHEFDLIYNLIGVDVAAMVQRWSSDTGDRFRPLMKKLDKVLDLAAWREATKGGNRYG